MNNLRKIARLVPHVKAAAMTEDIRNHAVAHGWDPIVASTLQVKYNGENYQVHIPEHHADAAFKHEYGSETSSPTAAIRKYAKTIMQGKA